MASTMAYFIDDESSTEGRRYQTRLARAPGFECHLLPPPNLDALDSYITQRPDLFLIDYELSLVQADGSKASYQGSTLAAELRTRYPDCPIILVTRESILNQLDRRTKRQLTDRIQLFDDIILKGMLDDNIDDTRNLLISIAQGFQSLSKFEDKSWVKLMHALEANEGEARALREAAPPLQEGDWIVTGAAHWIRNVVLEYPGIVYDSVNAATRLGIDTQSFLEDPIQELFRPAAYTGVFSMSVKCWWKDRLLSIAQQFVSKHQLSGPINRTFREAAERAIGLQLTPANCVWDKSPGADWVCYILQKPVKIKNSLRYYPDNRPGNMDHARVSFRAIRESNRFDDKLLDAEGARLIPKIEALQET